jgi:hypothetical protein
VTPEGLQIASHYGAYKFHAGLVKLHLRKHTSAPMLPHTHPHTHTHTHTQERTRTQSQTQTEECLRVIAFPRQQWFRKRASMLPYMYIACLVFLSANRKELFPFVFLRVSPSLVPCIVRFLTIFEFIYDTSLFYFFCQFYFFVIFFPSFSPFLSLH